MRAIASHAQHSVRHFARIRRKAGERREAGKPAGPALTEDEEITFKGGFHEDAIRMGFRGFEQQVPLEHD